MNEAIISANGIFKQHTGGFLKENAIPNDSLVSEITLMQKHATAGKGVDLNKGEDILSGGLMIIETGILTFVQAAVWTVLFRFYLCL